MEYYLYTWPLLFLMLFSNGITYLSTRKRYRKLESKVTLSLDGAIGQLWELRQLINPELGAFIIVMDKEGVYQIEVNNIKENAITEKATAKKLSTHLLSKGWTWTNPEMQPLTQQLAKAKAKIKELQKKFDEEEKQLESKREKLLQLETSEEIRLLMSGS